MIISHQQPVALVMDSWTSGLGVIRSLGAEGVPVLALDPNPLAVGLYSRFAAKTVCPDPLRSENAFLESLINIARHLRVPGVLFPTADSYVVAIAKTRDQLERYYSIPVSSWDVMRHIVDKERQYEKAKRGGIPVPQTLAPNSLADAREIALSVEYPVILKPCYSYPFVIEHRTKAVQVESPAEFMEKYTRYAASGHKMLVQEIIPGDADQLYEFCSYTNSDGEPLGAFVQRKLEQYPADYGTGTVFENVDEPNIVDLGIQLLKIFGCHGISFSEFKRDPRDGQFKLMELNPRVTHCNSLATACGVNLPYIAYQDALGRIGPEAHRHYDGRWTDIEQRLPVHGFACTKVKGHPLSRSRKRVYAVFSSSDPVPALVFYGTWPYRWMRKAFRRVQEQLERTAPHGPRKPEVSHGSTSRADTQMHYAEFIRMKIRHNPFLRVVLDGLAKLGIKIYPFRVFLHGLSVAAPVNMKLGDEYEFGLFGPQDMKMIASIPFRRTSHEELLRRLQSGMMCFGAKQRGELVAFLWCNIERCFFKGVSFELKDDEAFLFDAYTMDSFRGKGIAPYLCLHTYNELAKLGKYKMYTISPRFNALSQRFHRKLNAKLIGSGLLVELFHRWHFSSISEKDIIRE